MVAQTQIVGSHVKRCVIMKKRYELIMIDENTSTIFRVGANRQIVIKNLRMFISLLNEFGLLMDYKIEAENHSAYLCTREPAQWLRWRVNTLSPKWRAVDRKWQNMIRDQYDYNGCWLG
jgi:hypothetical protein